MVNGSDYECLVCEKVIDSRHSIGPFLLASNRNAQSQPGNVALQGHGRCRHVSWLDLHKKGWQAMKKHATDCTCSRNLLASMRFLSSSSSLHMTRTSGALRTAAMTRRQVASTARNLRPSLGICCRMSSLPKMGSRYSQPCRRFRPAT